MSKTKIWSVTFAGYYPQRFDVVAATAKGAIYKACMKTNRKHEFRDEPHTPKNVIGVELVVEADFE